MLKGMQHEGFSVVPETVIQFHQSNADKGIVYKKRLMTFGLKHFTSLHVHISFKKPKTNHTKTIKAFSHPLVSFSLS